MTVFVALLRGINVGGRTVLPMAQLRQVATDAGFGDVQTYIQSGNLVLTSLAQPTAVVGRLEQAIAAACGVQTRVALRSAAELAGVVAGNPYLDRAAEPRQLHVAFLVDGADPPALDHLDPGRFAPEELTVSGRETYLYLPNGIGRSKLAETVFRPKRNAAAVTARNWNSVTKLLAMAEATPHRT